MTLGIIIQFNVNSELLKCLYFFFRIIKIQFPMPHYYQIQSRFVLDSFTFFSIAPTRPNNHHWVAPVRAGYFAGQRGWWSRGWFGTWGNQTELKQLKIKDEKQ